MVALDGFDGHAEFALAVLDDVALIKHAVQERYPLQSFDVCSNDLIRSDDNIVTGHFSS